MARTQITLQAEERSLRHLHLPVGGSLAALGSHLRQAIGTARHDLAAWGAGLAGSLRSAGGELSDRERRWAEHALGLGAPRHAGFGTSADRHPCRRPHLRVVPA